LLYDGLEEKDQFARCLLNRGLIHSKTGRLSEARADIEVALEFFSANQRESHASSARLLLAKVVHIQGESALAGTLLDNVLSRTSTEQDPRKHVIALEYLGDLAIDARHFSKAVSLYRQARSEASVIGLATDIFIETTHRLGMALAHLGDHDDEAFDLLDDAIERASGLGDAFEHCAALLARGVALALRGSTQAAVVELQSCESVATEIGDRITRGRVSLALSMAFETLNQNETALAYSTQSIHDFEFVGAPLLTTGAREWHETLTRRAVATLGRDESEENHRRKPNPGPMALIAIPGFISQDARVHQTLLRTLRLAPRASLSLLVLGETGTGKELVAEAIHLASGRKGTFVPINCGALPGDLLESELFGHVRGAYTGADRERGGLIEFSDRGTLFLDEIGDMPLKAQARLLRALERGEIRRLGENSPRLVDLRIVAATHRNLLEMVSAGEFRLDLYHRLSGFVVTIPPLRERKGDIELLVDHFLASYASEQDKLVQMSPDVRASLVRHSWPGNVRQLKNVIHRLVSLSEPGQVITRLPFELEGAETPRSLPEALDAEERRRIIAALEASRWNKAKAAVALGASRTTLIAKMKRLGIEPPDNGARVR
jgi:DNA-binding NtrC family response regulator/tetratricopeptide (TPR) repeat protein